MGRCRGGGALLKCSVSARAVGTAGGASDPVVRSILAAREVGWGAARRHQLAAMHSPRLPQPALNPDQRRPIQDHAVLGARKKERISMMA